MASQPAASPSSDTATPPTDTPADVVYPWPPMASAIEKLPPRPAPTWAYSWDEWSPHARIVYLRDTDEANHHLSRLQPGALGFDLEWKPNYVRGGQENPVALVQLANDTTIFLLQVSAMKEFPSKLRDILEDGAYIKAGVGIQGDTKKLFTDWEVSVRNCADLSLLARTVDGARWRGKYNMSIGLARLIEVYCYRLLGKGKITRSNWEALLKPNQQLYAANDAHAGYILYKQLIAMVDKEDPPEAKYYTFDCVRGYYCEPSGLPWYAVNPKYDPGPPPPPRPRKENSTRKGKDRQAEDGSTQEPGDEPEQSDPSVVIQRHESVLKIAHSTWVRQRDAASAQQQHFKRPRDQQRGAYPNPQPFHIGGQVPPRHNPHFQHQPRNSFHGSEATSSSQRPFEPVSPTHHSPPVQRPRLSYARNPNTPSQGHSNAGGSATSNLNTTSPPATSLPPGGGTRRHHPRSRRTRKPQGQVPVSQSTAQAQA